MIKSVLRINFERFLSCKIILCKSVVDFTTSRVFFYVFSHDFSTYLATAGGSTPAGSYF